MNNKLMVMCRFVEDLSTLSKCQQRGVAAILVTPDLDQILSIGINGAAKGGVQCLCTLGSKYTCLHAEQNMLAKNKSDATGMHVIQTLAPCIQCAAAMINAGITKVYYLWDWKDNSGLKMLENAGVQVIKVHL